MKDYSVTNSPRTKCYVVLCGCSLVHLNSDRLRCASLRMPSAGNVHCMSRRSTNRSHNTWASSSYIARLNRQTPMHSWWRRWCKDGSSSGNSRGHSLKKKSPARWRVSRIRSSMRSRHEGQQRGDQHEGMESYSQPAAIRGWLASRISRALRAQFFLTNRKIVITNQSGRDGMKDESKHRFVEWLHGCLPALFYANRQSLWQWGMIGI